MLGVSMKSKERNQLLQVLKDRFVAHMHRHADITWETVLARLDATPAALQVAGRDGVIRRRAGRDRP
jgi:hypothetical protein